MAQIRIEVVETGVRSAANGLDSLNRSGTGAELTMSGVGEAAKTASGYILAAGASVAAFTAIMVANSRELKTNANNAGLTVDEFQSIAFAADTVGVSAGQLGDILADTQEKVGDFIVTGGGGFQDFADVMGMTKEEARATALEFEKLSGREVLVEMTKQMQAAEVSTQQMSFALEGMASDSRNLIPLLIGNGAELDQLSGKFSYLATTLDNETVKSLGEMNTAALLVANNMGNTLATALSSVSDYLVTAGENAAFFWASLQSGTKQQVLSDMADLDDKIDFTRRRIEMLEESDWDPFGFRADGISDLKADIEEYTAQLEKLRAQYHKMEGLVPPDRSGAGGNDSGGVPEGETPQEKKARLSAEAIEKIQQKSIANQVAALQDSFLTEQEILNKKVALVEKSALAEAAKIELIDQLEAQYREKKGAADKAAALAEQTAIDNQVASLQAQFDTEQEIYEQKRALVEQSTLDEVEKIELLTQLYDEYNTKLTEDQLAMASLIQSTSSAMSSSISSGITGIIDGSKSAKEAVTGVLSSMTSAIIQAGVDILVQKYVTDNIVKALNLTAVTSQVAQNAALAGQAAFVGAASTPIIGPAIAPAAAAAATVTATGLGAPAIAAASARMQEGQVEPGQVYQWQERGNEYFTSGSKGSVVGEDSGGNGKAVNVYVSNNVPNAVATEEQDANGDVYVRIDQLDSYVGGIMSNPDSDGYRGLNSTVNLNRS